jgi:hypothetical protein
VSLLKPDIWTAVYHFVTCQWSWSGDDAPDSGGVRRGSSRCSTTTVPCGISSGSLRVLETTLQQRQPHTENSEFLETNNRNSSLGGSFDGALSSLDQQSGSINTHLDGTSGSCSSSSSIKEKLEMDDIYEAINKSILFVVGGTNNDDDTNEATSSNDCEMVSPWK